MKSVIQSGSLPTVLPMTLSALTNPSNSLFECVVCRIYIVMLRKDIFQPKDVQKFRVLHQARPWVVYGLCTSSSSSSSSRFLVARRAEGERLRAPGRIPTVNAAA